MKGVQIKFDDAKNNVLLTLTPSDFEKTLDFKAILGELKKGETGKLHIDEARVKSAVDEANLNFKSDDKKPVHTQVGERVNAQVEFKVANDAMSATLIVTSPFGGRMPDARMVRNIAYKYKVQKGFSMKRTQALLDEAKNADPGKVFEAVVAKGLPPKDGKNSRFIPLVPNALERVLRPQVDDHGKADMRDLGELVCVKAGTEVLKRAQPDKGRKGFDVTGKKLDSKPGDWVEFKMGKGTEVSPHNQNVLIATMAGMPKFDDNVMNIDDTFICKGVNVGTGHISYEGSVLVNGDVTEKMVIRASGDVTINGFVESATIEADGDIIITQGALGKVNEENHSYSCKLKAQGNIHVQHAQGIDFECCGNVTVGKQLAYSRVKAGGGVTVGNVDNPMGNLFACEIYCQAAVYAGSLGAVSGSSLKVDFTDGFNALLDRKDAVDELLSNLRDNNYRHQQKLKLIESKLAPKVLQAKIKEIAKLVKDENALLQWLEDKAENLKQAKENYQQGARIVANKRLYSGVSVRLNNRTWRSEREYDRSIVRFEAHQWHFEPIV